MTQDGGAHVEPAVRAHFTQQAEACDRLGSPFTAALCRVLGEVLDRSTSAGRRVLDWAGDPRADALALRLCGALHAMVLAKADKALAAAYPPARLHVGDLRDIVPPTIYRNDAFITAFLDGPPQTNEIGRAAMLLPGFLAIARESGLPLDIREIGSSAGLNLLFDQFRYDYHDVTWGDPDSPVALAPEVRNGAVPLIGKIEIRTRRGCDLAPVHLSDPDQRVRLRAFIWPDQPERLARFDAAVDLARIYGSEPIAQDAATFVRESLDGSRAGGALVLFHSIVWQYLPDTTKRDIADLMTAAGHATSKDSPLAWLRMEPRLPDAHAALTLTMWPGGVSRELARCDSHGRWIEWTEVAPR